MAACNLNPPDEFESYEPPDTDVETLLGKRVTLMDMDGIDREYICDRVRYEMDRPYGGVDLLARYRRVPPPYYLPYPREG